MAMVGERYVPLIQRLPILRTMYSFIIDIGAATRLFGTVRGRLVAVCDMMLMRVFILYRSAGKKNLVRDIVTKAGLHIRYRMDFGDLLSVHEIFYQQVYRIPASTKRDVLIDLGANIGLTTLFFSKVYGFKKIIAVEPDLGNAAMMRKLFQENGVSCELLEGVIAESSGVMSFAAAEWSNGGKIAEGDTAGIEVRSYSMEEILARTPDNYADVVKMDIEGYEENLIGGDNNWLDRVGCLLVEFHYDWIDAENLIRILKQKGFYYIQGDRRSRGTAWARAEHAFVKGAAPSTLATAATI